MSIDTMNLRATVKWTWRVATPQGTRFIPDTTIGVAVRLAGLCGPESIQPATSEEHAKAVSAPAMAK